ncbi:MAG TPA: phosphohydrolase [Deltaproteobacteria bacterium]|nr:phosphohydrolase [Deltaproteobacteria bacterium]
MSERIFNAIEFAAKAHKGQYRKGTNIPYIIHPIRVAKILIESRCPEDVVVAGILHDTLEDTSVTIDEIREQFGDAVAAIVVSVSEPNKLDAWEIRKRFAIDSLKNAPNEVLLVACADHFDNIVEIEDAFGMIGDDVWLRFNRPKEQQGWYYKSLADIFSRRTDDERIQFLATRLKYKVQKIFA